MNSGVIHITLFIVFIYGQPCQEIKVFDLLNIINLAMNCPFKLTVSYDRAQDHWIVKDCCLEHNHCIGEEFFKHYTAHCKLSVAEETEVSTALSLKANAKHLKEHAKKTLWKFYNIERHL